MTKEIVKKTDTITFINQLQIICFESPYLNDLRVDRLFCPLQKSLTGVWKSIARPRLKCVGVKIK